MEIKLEIHAPGLDLHHERWNHHVLFMDKVHEHAVRIAACAWDHYRQLGRGALFVDKDQWMVIIKSDAWTDDRLFPCGYVTGVAASGQVDVAPLGAGFAEAVRRFDPEKELVLLVEHHPGNQLSTYVIEPDITPPEAAEELKRFIAERS